MPATENFEPGEQHRLAEHLRKFRPVAPGELKLPDRGETRWALAVAAIVLIAMALTFFRYRPQPVQVSVQKPVQLSRPLTAAQLQTALLAGDDQFYQLLDEASPRILPHGRSGTVLYELGKE
jgi:hypothetical protein